MRVALVVQLARHRQLEILLLAFEVALALAQREFRLPCALEVLCLRIEFFSERGQLLSGLLLGIFAALAFSRARLLRSAGVRSLL